MAVTRASAASPSRARRRASTAGILPHPLSVHESAGGSRHHGYGSTGGERRSMDDAALVVWLLSAAAGLTLGTIWLLRGGLRQRDEVLELSYAQVSEATNLGDRTPPARRSRLPVWVVSTHAALALLGLFLWIYYIDHQ